MSAIPLSSPLIVNDIQMTVAFILAKQASFKLFALDNDRRRRFHLLRIESGLLSRIDAHDVVARYAETENGACSITIAK